MILKHASWESEALQGLLPLLNGEHLEHAQSSQHAPITLKGKAFGSHMIGWKYSIHKNTPTMIWGTKGGQVDGLSSVRKAIHMNIVSTFAI